METSQAVLSVNGSDENRPAIVNVSMTTLSLSLSPLLVPLRGEIIERWGNNGAPLCANSKVARLPNTRI